jgi:hypothetical protein
MFRNLGMVFGHYYTHTLSFLIQNLALLKGGMNVGLTITLGRVLKPFASIASRP